jgi:hypothetical protein
VTDISDYEDLVSYLLQEPERTRWATYARQNLADPRTHELRARATIQTLAERLIWIEERIALAQEAQQQEADVPSAP